MIEAFRKDDALLEDIRETDRDNPSFRLWWLGQSGFLVQWRHKHLLIDPYLSDSLTKKYAATDKPHVRMTELAIRPERLDFIDLITSSHNHTDHLDAETLMPLLRANPSAKLVIPEANRAFVAERLQLDPRDKRLLGADAGEAVEHAGFRIVGIPSAHEEVERDDEWRCKYLGYIIQFGPWSIYHSGDTLRYDGMVHALAPFQIDVALLPINGRAPERRVAGNLSGKEAATLANEIGARMVIPCHFDMFTFNTASPEEFVRECERLGQPHRVLACGERWQSQALGRSV